MKSFSRPMALAFALLGFASGPLFAANSAGASPFSVLREAVISGDATSRTYFGDGEMDPIGDFDQNGTEDFLIGSYRSLFDTGAFYIEMLNPNGSYKGRFVVSPSLYGTQQNLFNQYTGFGYGVSVIQKFTALNTSCAEFVTTSSKTLFYMTYVVKLCRDGTSLNANVELKTDTTDASLKSTGITSSQYGRSVRLLDTLSTGELLFAFGAHYADGGTGKIYLMALNATRTTWRRVGIIDSTKLGGLQKAGDQLGSSIAVIPDQDNDGMNDLAVVAQGDDSYNTFSANNGAVYILPLDEKAQVIVAKIKKITGADIPPFQNVSSIASSIATADMNHDGITDLIIGNVAVSGSTFTYQGAIGILTRKADGSIDSVSVIKKGTAGFIDSNNVIDRNYYDFGTRVQAFDYNHDGMVDLFAGAKLHKEFGGIWAFQMKSGPWMKSTKVTGQLAADTNTSKTYTTLVLDTLFAGTGLTYNISYTGDPTIATCSIISGAQNILACNPGFNTATTKVTIDVTDSNNVPSTDHFTIRKDIPINVISGNVIPTSTLPTSVHLNEDFTEANLWALSTYFADSDGPNALKYTLSSTGSSLLTSIVHDSLHVVPIANANGTTKVTITADDGLTSVQSTMEIIVDAIADAPTTGRDSVSTPEDTPLTIAVLANDSDPDGQTLAIATAANPSHGTAVIQGTSLLYTPNLNFAGLDTISYTATDGSLSTSGLAIVLVSAVNDTPTVVTKLGTRTVPEDTASFTIPITTLFTDIETPQASLQISVVQRCQSTLASTKQNILQPGFLIVTPISNAHGSCKVVLQGKDEEGLSGYDTLNLTITSVEDPFQFTWTKEPLLGHKIEILRSEPVSMPFDPVDVDGDSLRYVWNSLPKWLSWDSTTRTLTDIASVSRTSQRVLLSVFEGTRTQFSDTSTVTFSSVDSITPVVQNTTPPIFLYLKRTSHALNDFSGPYTAQVLSINGRTLWTKQSQKALGESIRLIIPQISEPAILRIKSRRSMQSFHINP